MVTRVMAMPTVMTRPRMPAIAPAPGFTASAWEWSYRPAPPVLVRGDSARALLERGARALGVGSGSLATDSSLAEGLSGDVFCSCGCGPDCIVRAGAFE